MENSQSIFRLLLKEIKRISENQLPNTSNDQRYNFIRQHFQGILHYISIAGEPLYGVNSTDVHFIIDILKKAGDDVFNPNHNTWSYLRAQIWLACTPQHILDDLSSTAADPTHLELTATDEEDD